MNSVNWIWKNIKSNLLLIKALALVIIILTLSYLKTTCSFITILGLSLICPILALQLFLINNPILNIFALSIIVPLLVMLLFGRTVCGWLCPLGLMKDLINSKLKIKRLTFHINGRAMLVLPIISLTTLLLASYLTNYPLYCLVCPIGAIYRVILGFSLFSFDISLLLYSILFLLVISVTNIWCLGLCPHGALYTILGYFKLPRVTNNENKCIHCNVCLQICPLRLQIQRATKYEHASCTMCLMCLTKCPKNSLSIKLSSINSSSRRS